MKFLKWLYPGLRVKRWLLLFIAGVTILLIVALYGVRMIAQHSILLALFIAALIMFSLFVVVTAIKNMMRTIVRGLIPQHDHDVDIATVLYEKKQERTRERGPRVVVVGGGTGLNVLLQGVKQYTSNVSAIVTVTDTGGSSGRLRDEFDMLPPGDIRNCLVALADEGPLLSELFQYRFDVGDGLKGHSFGNLFITALSKITGCFDKAVKEAGKVLGICGQVIPSTLDHVTLVAQFEDGSSAEGETNIVDCKKRITAMTLRPVECVASSDAVTAIEVADFIILGPGSLYTSVLPNLLINGIREAIQKSDAFKIYVTNVMTQPGETDHMSAYDHYNVIHSHTGEDVIDACLVDVSAIPDDIKEKYAAQDQYPVVLDADRLEAEGIEVCEENVVSAQDRIRHDSAQLAKTLFEVYEKLGAGTSDAEQ